MVIVRKQEASRLMVKRQAAGWVGLLQYLDMSTA